VIIFYYLRGVKQFAMKYGVHKNIGIAGCEKNPVAVSAPVYFIVDVNFL
jgi:hypothetical protein